MQLGSKVQGIPRMTLPFSQEGTLLFVSVGSLQVRQPVLFTRSAIRLMLGSHLLPHGHRNRTEVVLASIWLHLLSEPTSSAISSVFLPLPGFPDGSPNQQPPQRVQCLQPLLLFASCKQPGCFCVWAFACRAPSVWDSLFSQSGTHFLPHLITNLTLFRTPPQRKVSPLYSEHIYFFILEAFWMGLRLEGDHYAHTLRYLCSHLFSAKDTEIPCWGGAAGTEQNVLAWCFPGSLVLWWKHSGWWNLQFTMVLPELRKPECLLRCSPFILRVYLVVLGELVLCASVCGTFPGRHPVLIFESSAASAGRCHPLSGRSRVKVQVSEQHLCF